MALPISLDEIRNDPDVWVAHLVASRQHEWMLAYTVAQLARPSDLVLFVGENLDCLQLVRPHCAIPLTRVPQVLPSFLREHLELRRADTGSASLLMVLDAGAMMSFKQEPYLHALIRSNSEFQARVLFHTQTPKQIPPALREAAHYTIVGSETLNEQVFACVHASCKSQYKDAESFIAAAKAIARLPGKRVVCARGIMRSLDISRGVGLKNQLPENGAHALVMSFYKSLEPPLTWDQLLAQYTPRPQQEEEEEVRMYEVEDADSEEPILQMPGAHPRFKVIVAGDGGVGKTTFIRRHLQGDFDVRYIPTMGVEVNPLRCATSRGDIVFNLWDVGGQDKFSGLADGYFIRADAAVVMFDVTSRSSYKSADDWIRRLRANNPSMPIVLCGNKVDCKDRKVKPGDIHLHRKHGLMYYDISTKSMYNFEKPWLELARQLVKDPELVFVEKEVMLPSRSAIPISIEY